MLVKGRILENASIFRVMTFGYVQRTDRSFENILDNEMKLEFTKTPSSVNNLGALSGSKQGSISYRKNLFLHTRQGWCTLAQIPNAMLEAKCSLCAAPRRFKIVTQSSGWLGTADT